MRTCIHILLETADAVADAVAGTVSITGPAAFNEVTVRRRNKEDCIHTTRRFCNDEM